MIFNRYLYPDIDLDTREFTTELTLTTSEDVRVPLRWIGILRGEMPDASLAATSGINTTHDVVKLLLAGADITMIAGVLFKQGPEVVSQLVDGLRTWLEEREYEFGSAIERQHVRPIRRLSPGIRSGELHGNACQLHWTGRLGISNALSKCRRGSDNVV